MSFSDEEVYTCGCILFLESEVDGESSSNELVERQGLEGRRGSSSLEKSESVSKWEWLERDWPW